MNMECWKWGNFFSRGEKKFTDTECPNKGLCFGELVRRSKLWMGVIKKQDSKTTSEMSKAMLVGFYI